MSAPTESEELFVELCATCGIAFTRIQEAGGQGIPRPDYEVLFGGRRVIVEVKQFDPNDAERPALQEMANNRGKAVVLRTMPGDRIRKAIGYSRKQLGALSGGSVPALLVVYDNVLGSMHTDPYSVATAMRGLDMVPVIVPRDPAVSPEFQEVRSGGKRQMTPNVNTTISAIGVLARDAQGAALLSIFYNPHARNPIVPSWIRHPRIGHFGIPAGSSSSVDGWETL